MYHRLSFQFAWPADQISRGGPFLPKKWVLGDHFSTKNVSSGDQNFQDQNFSDSTCNQPRGLTRQKSVKTDKSFPGTHYRVTKRQTTWSPLQVPLDKAYPRYPSQGDQRFWIQCPTDYVHDGQAFPWHSPQTPEDRLHEGQTNLPS